MEVLLKRIPGGTWKRHRERAQSVVKYMSNRENNKCVFIKGFSFRGCEPDDTQAMWREMADVANIYDKENRHFCLAHYALSVKLAPGDDKPSPETLVKAARHAMRELGATSGTPFIVAVHDDRDHPHAHILFSRVDRDRWRMVDDNHTLDGQFIGGWKNVAQYAAASVAQSFGWDVPAGSRFEPSGKTQKTFVEDPETGLMREWDRPVPKRTRGRRSVMEPPGSAALEEKRTGLVSSERRIQERTRTVDLAAISDFRDLHRSLARIGVTVERVQRGKGYGLVFTDGERRVKGSHIGGKWSLPALERALGPYAAPTQKDIEAARQFSEPPHLTTDSLQELKKAGITEAQVKAISTLPADHVKNVKSKRPHHSALGLLASKFGAVAAVKALIKRFPHMLALIRRDERRREMMFKRSIERAEKRFWKGVQRAGYKKPGSPSFSQQGERAAGAGESLPGDERRRL